MAAHIERLDAQRGSVARARAHLLSCEQARDEAIRDAAKLGMSVRQIAAHSDLSHQRVAQILKR